MWGGTIYLTGLAKAVEKDDEQAEQMLRRDIHSILSFFNRTGSFPNLKELKEKTFEYVTATMEELERVDFFEYLESQLCCSVC
ncbi:uncharacterized protein [Blastocystis hominis]|uniref:non-specific serine/threonine protein kinase n=1 Tax=Blastocystis hominis TaxID=12968 RepID=D8M2N4_BLAHO|nr:uncharacterized protein [Blastocystis hominis]CBK22323.2 unnamed protein product [Blastocystis hominis]|eukprot:XP_012896371.1 uncharacterized protein [Blastocystis hominis]